MELEVWEVDVIVALGLRQRFDEVVNAAMSYQVEVGKLRERELAAQQAHEVSDRVQAARPAVEAVLYERLDRASSHQQAAAVRGLADAQEKVRLAGERLFVAGGPKAAELLFAYLSDRAHPVSRTDVSDHLRSHAAASPV